MLKLIFSLSLVGTLLFVGYAMWTERQKTITFDVSAYRVDDSHLQMADYSLISLGKRLFHDPRLSQNQEVSCASCHKLEHSFADSEPVSLGIKKTFVNAPPLINMQFQKWFFWDGRADNLVSQVLQPLMNPREHGLTPQSLAETFRIHYESEADFILKKATKINANRSIRDQQLNLEVAKALAAYVNSLVALESPFDRFMANYQANDEPNFVEGFGPDEWHGFQVFLGKARCASCHGGALFTDQDFYVTGLASEHRIHRPDAIQTLSQDPLRCFGKDDCTELPESSHPMSVRTPTLRNLVHTAPYLHDGSAPTIRDVLYRYMRPRPVEDRHQDITNLYLNALELNNLEKFLVSLTSPVRELGEQLEGKTQPSH